MAQSFVLNWKSTIAGLATVILGGVHAVKKVLCYPLKEQTCHTSPSRSSRSQVSACEVRVNRATPKSVTC